MGVGADKVDVIEKNRAFGHLVSPFGIIYRICKIYQTRTGESITQQIQHTPCIMT